MEKKNLSDLDVSELMKKKVSLKTILGAFMGILSVFAVLLIMLFVQKQYTVALPLTVVLFSSSTIFFINKKQLGDVNAEIEKRENDDMI